MLRSKTYFAAGRRIIRAGDLLPEDDPIVKGREGLFETVPGTAKATTTKSAAKRAKAPASAKPKADTTD